MFYQASAFNNGGNSNINNWTIRTSGTVNMSEMFRAASSFNQPIGSWNTSSVNAMGSIFRQATNFNQDISSWNVSLVPSFQNAFISTAFNQNIGSWALRTAGVSLLQIFGSGSMSTANYTDTIVGWANYVFVNGGLPATVNMTLQTGRTFQNSRSGGANFANAGLARTYLTTATPAGAGWTISGDTVIP
jgi:surface protein